MGKEKVDDQNQEVLVGGPTDERGCTDILCCIFFCAYMVFMVVLAVMGMNDGKPLYLVAPWDSSYLPCGIDTSNDSDYENGKDLSDYKFIYFSIPHPDYLYKTTCVKECPTEIDDEAAALAFNLECNTASDYYDDTTGCAHSCSLWDFAGSAGWGSNTITDAQVNTLNCIYSTESIMDRACLPLTSVFNAVGNLSDKINSAINMDTVVSWYNDVEKGQLIIYLSFLFIFVLGAIYMGFVRIFSGAIVWLMILLYFVLLALLGSFLYDKNLTIKDNITANDGVEYEGNTEDTRKTYEYTAYAIGIIWILSLIGLFCMWNNIRLAIAIIKTATGFTVTTPQAFFVPIVMAIVTIVWWIVWFIFFAYVYSIGTISKKSDTSIIAKTDHTDEQWAFVWCFIFGGLWVNAFLQAITQFILASICCIWYYNQPEQTVHNPVRTSIRRAFRYHLGSLAFGAFILAVVQTIRLMLEYIAKQVEASGGSENKAVKCLLKCLRCVVACFERFIRFLNKIAFIQMALTGQNFCSSARSGMNTVWSNANRVSLVSGLGAAFMFVGKVFMIVTNLYICYLIYTEAEPYKTEMNSTFLPLIIIFVISWGVSVIYMSIYGMAIDTILLCFLYDEKEHRGDTSGKMRAPEPLKSFFAAHDEKAEYERQYKAKMAEIQKKR